MMSSGILTDGSLGTLIFVSGKWYNYLHCSFLWYNRASSSSSLHASVTLLSNKDSKHWQQMVVDR